MASLRRSRASQNDAAMTKFLYTILKQLDLKSIDWQEVANGLDITNGHAARMRYSRFRQQMEGLPAVSRKSKPGAPRQKKTKANNCPDNSRQPHEEPPVFTVKRKPESHMEEGKNAQAIQGFEPIVKPELAVKEEPLIKSEPGAEQSFLPTINSVIGRGQDDPLYPMGAHEMCDESVGSGKDLQTAPASSTPKVEPVVKLESNMED